MPQEFSLFEECAANDRAMNALPDIVKALREALNTLYALRDHDIEHGGELYCRVDNVGIWAHQHHSKSSEQLRSATGVTSVESGCSIVLRYGRTVNLPIITLSNQCSWELHSTHPAGESDTHADHQVQSSPSAGGRFFYERIYLENAPAFYIKNAIYGS